MLPPNHFLNLNLQVKIPLKDRNALRFLWFDGESIIQYRLTSHLFGGRWCASSSTFAMRHTIIDTAANTLVADTIQTSFYVDVPKRIQGVNARYTE